VICFVWGKGYLLYVICVVILVLVNFSVNVPLSARASDDLVVSIGYLFL